MTPQHASDASLLDLFRLEAEEQTQSITANLLALEREPAHPARLESCMRAAHSLKGAARIVGIDAGVELAHAMESCFVAAQRGLAALDSARINALLQAVDVLRRISQTSESELNQWQRGSAEVASCIAALAGAERIEIRGGASTPVAAPVPATATATATLAPSAADSAQYPAPASAPEAPPANRETRDRFLRVTAHNLNRLSGLAGESLVESRRVQGISHALARLKRQHNELAATLLQLREALAGEHLGERAQAALLESERRALECRAALMQRLADLEGFDQRSADLSQRMYEGTLALRMRPFSDGTRAFPRMVRDLGQRLNKQARLEIEGGGTEVDRDMLEKLDAPLGHLLRNAVAHGIEPAEARLAAGKPAEGVIRLEARHLGGRLNVAVSDDGAGVPADKLREAVEARKLASAETIAKLSESELYEFLLLPGFSMSAEVTDISGRGVGLDVVRETLRQLRGTLRINSTAGKGTRFEFQLPLTQSLIRSLLVEIGGEPYAVPLASIARAAKIPVSQLRQLEGRTHFELDGEYIGVVGAQQMLGAAQPEQARDTLAVLILGAGLHRYGLIVDRFLGERELVAQPLDPRLGKVKDISAVSQMEDGSAMLIVDVEDLLRSAQKQIGEDSLSALRPTAAAAIAARRKRVLVVDDSLTVRELERKLLVNGGYEVEIAVDGMDAWNAVRGGGFDLLLTDIDMPRMDGIELVTLVKREPTLQSTPVMIVSYKDRPEDRQRGLEAGADYYLAKSSFHDDTLLEAVADLIGAAAA